MRRATSVVPAAVVTLVGGALLGGSLAAPAEAATASPSVLARSSMSTAGLFGSSDPTYDGVFRQGLAITGLVAARAPVPAPAITWLRRQQCANGGFEAFRTDLRVPCTPGSPITFTGTDTNSTALAAMAFTALRDPRRARAAVIWLRHTQNSDGGFPFYPGGTSDANSTGLVLAALRGSGFSPALVRRTSTSTSALTYLARVQAGCMAAVAARGGIAYQGPAPLLPNDLATAQAALGTVGTLPVSALPTTRAVTRLTCVAGRATVRRSVADSATGYLARRLVAGRGALPNAFGPGADLSATSWAALSLVSARTGGTAVRAALGTLRRHAGSFARGRDGKDQPGALGLMLLVARATGASTSSFGGVDLVARLRATRQA